MISQIGVNLSLFLETKYGFSENIFQVAFGDKNGLSKKCGACVAKVVC